MFYKMPLCRPTLLVYYSIMMHSTVHLNTAENGRIDGTETLLSAKKIHSGEKRKLMFCCIYWQYNHQKKTCFLYNMNGFISEECLICTSSLINSRHRHVNTLKI